MKLEKIPYCFLFPVGASLYFSCSTGLVISEQSAILEATSMDTLNALSCIVVDAHSTNQEKGN